MADIGERLFENNVRIDWVVPLAGIQSPLCEILRDFVYEAGEREWAMLKEAMPTVAKHFDNDEEMETYEVDDYFVDGAISDKLTGFLIRTSVPVPTDRQGRGGIMFSWGYTHFATLYGKSIDEAMEVALAWGIKRWEADCAALPADPAAESLTEPRP